MKAILILDEMPTACMFCPCHNSEFGYCQNTEEWTDPDTLRRKDCPLIEIDEETAKLIEREK